MENYKKSKTVEEPLERNSISIPNLPQNFLWMQVRGGSKIRHLLRHACKEFASVKSIVWTGSGQSVGKAVTCTELMKREYENHLHQITKLSYRLVQEYWEPLMPELNQQVVTRNVPMIHIYLSIEPLDNEELGYQSPGFSIPSCKGEKKGNKRRFSKSPGDSRSEEGAGKNTSR